MNSSQFVAVSILVAQNVCIVICQLKLDKRPRSKLNFRADRGLSEYGR